jgi:hypothetical protein
MNESWFQSGIRTGNDERIIADAAADGVQPIRTKRSESIGLTGVD